jgi:hypothetical protein
MGRVIRGMTHGLVVVMRRGQDKTSLAGQTDDQDDDDDDDDTIPPQVTGATGGVGKRVVEELLKRGVRVRGLARNQGKALALLSKGVEPDPGPYKH